MLNLKEATALISKGPQAWNVWRKRNPGVYPVLDGIQLLDLNLEGIDFSGVSLCHAVINRCNLRSSSLVSARLHEANLRDNNFKSARMIASEMNDADLSGCVLNEANILTATVRGARFDEVDFKGHDLQALDLRDVSFRNADLSNQYLARSDLSGAILDGCRLVNSDLSHVKLSAASLINVDLSSAQLKAAVFQQANVSKSKFSSNTLEEVNFESAILVDCDFRQSKIKRCNFRKADLTGCMFGEVDTVDWTLSDAKCGYAYWDKLGKQKTYYGKHDFERIYSDTLTLKLVYPFRLSVSEISTLPILIEHLQATQWGTSIRLKSIKDSAGGSLVTLSIDEISAYNPSELRESLQREADYILMAQIAMRQDMLLQSALKEEVANIKENFWPRLLELAAENERQVIRNLTIIFMDLTGFSRWKDEELAHKLGLFRGLVKPILNRWNAGHPNMEGDSLRVTFKNATIALACACMLRNVLVAAGFELRMGLELGEVSIVHNVVTNQPDLEGTAVSMAARLEAAADPGEIIVTDRVKSHADHRGFFEFSPRSVALKKGIGQKASGDSIECYSITMIKTLDDFS
ncbi:MAG: pentapeptide repeat-containing protein [Cellvibrionaceae bacterium]